MLCISAPVSLYLVTLPSVFVLFPISMSPLKREQHMLSGVQSTFSMNFVSLFSSVIFLMTRVFLSVYTNQLSRVTEWKLSYLPLVSRIWNRFPCISVRTRVPLSPLVHGLLSLPSDIWNAHLISGTLNSMTSITEGNWHNFFLYGTIFYVLCLLCPCSFQLCWGGFPGGLFHCFLI